MLLLNCYLLFKTLSLGYKIYYWTMKLLLPVGVRVTKVLSRKHSEVGHPMLKQLLTSKKFFKNEAELKEAAI